MFESRHEPVPEGLQVHLEVTEVQRHEPYWSWPHSTPDGGLKPERPIHLIKVDAAAIDKLKPTSCGLERQLPSKQLLLYCYEGHHRNIWIKEALISWNEGAGQHPP